MAGATMDETILDAVARIVLEECGRRGVAAASAQDLARVVSRRLAEQWGGMSVYVPANAAQARAERYAAVVADWQAGRSVREIARRHQVTQKTVYAILRRRREILRPDLFSAPAGPARG